MPTFQGKTPASYFKNLFGINQSSNTGVDATTRAVHDGAGNSTSISLSDDVLSVQPVTDNTTGAFLVKNQDTTNSKVLLGASQVPPTNYAYFGISATDNQNISANNHYAIPFNMSAYGKSLAVPTFGTGTDPATSFTTSASSATMGSDIVPLLWRVPDDITIDEIKHFEGADAATGDTTRMHLMSYTFTSGSTSALSSGAVVANTSADNTNAGSEQAYLKNWTVQTADVDAGKVLLCFFRSDSVNSDFSITVTIKYHIR